MNEKELYEEQYGKNKIKMIPAKQFCGLRNFLKKYDWDRYVITHKLIEPGQIILDIGCGEGKLLMALLGEFKELYGLDIAPSRIQEAEAKVQEIYPSEVSKFKFAETTVNEPLNFSNDFFDAIICVAAMQQIYDILGLVKEMYRVIKPGGYIIAEVPNICYLIHRIEIALGKLPATSAAYNWDEVGWDAGHIHYFTMKKFCWLFEQQGFKVEKRTGSGFLAKFRNWWPSLLTGDLIIKARKV
jgi:methionine biosynthesis protein MetW